MNDVAWILIGIALWLYSLWHSYSVGFVRGGDDAWREALKRNQEAIDSLKTGMNELHLRANKLTKAYASREPDSTGVVH